jgi:hypothetical protein
MNGIGEPRPWEFTTKIFRSFQVLPAPNGHIYPRGDSVKFSKRLAPHLRTVLQM